ncbi:MAG: leucine-rich repeat domain-containing protein [Anaerolineae bacterium]
MTDYAPDSCEINRIAPEIGNLYNLRVLSLSGNQLTELPAEIGNLTHLEYLNLADNHLTKLPISLT